MESRIVVHPEFDRVWPFAADHFRRLWEEQAEVAFTRLAHDDDRNLGQILDDESEIARIVSLGVPLSEDCVETLSDADEAVVVTPESMYTVDAAVAAELEDRGVTVHDHISEDFWGQSVAEFALGLTIAALRQLPQRHERIKTDQSPWDFDPDGRPEPGGRGHQFCDDPRFTNGTVAGTRVRIVGVGNIGSRYADFASSLGADVAAYDPHADEPCFHRSDATRAWHLDDLLSDADVFAPMVPLTETTRRMIDRERVYALPEGCLVVLVTRAQICDMAAVRERVLDDELFLAADVWDDGKEPLPLDDPILDRPNVVHTPHIGGRTRDANEQWAENLAAQFEPIEEP